MTQNIEEDKTTKTGKRWNIINAVVDNSLHLILY